MVLKIYGGPTPCLQRVLLILYEKEVPFELVPVDLASLEHKGENYLKKQPFGLVPFMDDDGFILYETRAITQYIELKYPSKGTQGLIPKDLQPYSRFLQASSIETSYFNDFARTITLERIFKPMYYHIECNEKLCNDLINKLSSSLDVYESILAKQRYIGGDELTLADLHHVPLGALLPRAGCDAIEARPNVSRWFKELSSRKSWNDVQTICAIASPTPVSVN